MPNHTYPRENFCYTVFDGEIAAPGKPSKHRRRETESQRLTERRGMRKRTKYDPTLPKRMYTYFSSYKDAGAPSFDKFARSVGLTLAELEELRGKKELERAYRECNEIRRDYLIDTALAKRADASVAKFLLTVEYGMGKEEEKDDAGRLEVTLEVVD